MKTLHPYQGVNTLALFDSDPEFHMRNPYPDGFRKSTVPPGKSGPWSVERFTVNEREVSLFNLRKARDGELHRVVPPGEYTRLVHRGQVVMSDTPAEAREHSMLLRVASGRVLVAGLGLGLCLEALLNKPEVEHVHVVEQSRDVAKLVAPHFEGHRWTLEAGDALARVPAKGERWDCVWHDIWPTICEDNKPQMKALRSKYARRARWQGCWGEEYL